MRRATTLSRILAIVMSLLLALTSPAAADSNLPAASMADTQLSDPSQEAKAKALMEEVRCLVCQGQSIADSNAELAGDMRSLVRQRIAAGESPTAVKTWLISRYGNWISYDPPLDRSTWLLWVAPALLMVAGIIVARSSFRSRR